MSGITAKDIAVTVKITPAVMTSTIDTMLSFVKERVKDYDIEKYVGDMSELKADRAELNKGAESIKRLRIDTIKDASKPFEEFEKKAKEAEKLIQSASAVIDELIKSKELEEAIEKEKNCIAYWESIAFKLITFEKAKEKSGAKWLNVTYKFSDIKSDIDALIKKVRDELEVIKSSFPETFETIQALYLDCLDLGTAMVKGNQMKAAEEALKKDAETRPAQIIVEHKAAAQNELDREIRADQKNRRPESLAVIAAGNSLPSEPEKQTYCIVLSCTQAKKNLFKQFLIDNEIVFSQLNTGDIYNG